MNPWECPRCHKINAPITPCCDCKPGIGWHGILGVYPDPALQQQWPPCSHESDGICYTSNPEMRRCMKCRGWF